MSLHRAVYNGELERVRELVDSGADVNARAQEGEGWISALGECPRPLNCCAMAWTLTEEHLEIARLLIERGAVVDDSVRTDWLVEATEAEIWGRLYVLLGSAANPQWPGVEDFVWPPKISHKTVDPSLPMRRSSGAVLDREIKSASRIRTGSRLGVWGLVVGVGVMTAFTVGLPISLAAAMAVMGAGVFVSGIGTLVASTAVVRGTRSPTPLMRAAAYAGVPLGAVLSLLGLTSLTQWAPLVAIVNALTPAAGILGALVVILLVVGFIVGSSTEEEHDSFSPNGDAT